MSGVNGGLRMKSGYRESVWHSSANGNVASENSDP
jgi:hypothetical protein